MEEKQEFIGKTLNWMLTLISQCRMPMSVIEHHDAVSVSVRGERTANPFKGVNEHVFNLIQFIERKI